MANEFKIRKGLIVEGASGGTVVNVLGSQGQLLSVIDDLSGSIFAVSDISGIPVFDVNSSGLSTFDGNVLVGSDSSLLLSNNATVSAYAGTNDSLYLNSKGSGIVRVNYAGGTGGFEVYAGGTSSIFDVSTAGDGTFAGNITTDGSLNINRLLGSTPYDNFKISTADIVTTLERVENTGDAVNGYGRLDFKTNATVNVTGAAGRGGYKFIDGNAANILYLENLDKSATFGGKATSVATAASDGSTTLTTKGYVDGLVTGVPVYKGTWAAGTTGVTSAAISGTTITLTTAPAETIAIGDVVTAEGIIAATTVTAVGSQTSVTVSATVDIAITTTVTFSPEGGYPDLTDTAAKVLGNYYIVSTAGSAAPNGSGVEPDSWAVGDWCIFSDVTPGAGTDLWQRIDNSSVISGAGTGGKIPLWEGETNAVSETLTDSPITVSGTVITAFVNSLGNTGTFITNSEGGGEVGLTVQSRTNRAKLKVADNDSNAYVVAEDGKAFYGTVDAGNVQNITVLTDGRVGIGNTGPIQKLHVNGSNHIFTIENTSAVANQYAQMMLKAGTATNYIWTQNQTSTSYGGANSLNIYTQQASPIAFFTNGNNRRMTIAGSGEVGIGIDSPQANLDITGTSTDDRGLQIRCGDSSDQTDSAQIILSYAGNSYNSSGYAHSIRTRHNSAVATDNAIDFFLWSSTDTASTLGTKRVMTLEGTGNVGIGTTSPGALLEISGIRENQIRLTSRDTTAAVDETIGGIEFYSSDSGNEGVKASISAIAGDAAANAYMTFNTGVNTEQMRIDSAGNVGIGTDAPSRDGLNVFHTTGPYVHLTNTTTGDLSSDGGYISMVGTELRLGNQEAVGTLSIFTNNNTGNGITILSSGNVGIGTTSPPVKLSINGWSYNPGAVASAGCVGLKQSNNSAYGFVTEASDTDKWLMMGHNSSHGIIETTYAATAGHSDLYIKTGGSNYLILQSSGGNVGIGVTGPSSKLSVGGNATGFSTAMQVWQDGETASSGDVGGKAATFFGTSGLSNSSIVNIYSTGAYTGQTGGEIGFGGKYASGGNVAQFAKIRSFKTNASNGGANYGGGLEFWTRPNGSAAVPRMTILGEGNVGIGTTTPLAKLDIQGTQGQLFSVTDNLSGSIFAVADISGVPIFDVNSSGVSYFDGNVGIGRTSPGYKLDVNGNIRSSTVTVYDGMGGTETGIGASSAGGNLRLYAGGTNKITVSNTSQSLILYGNSTTGSNYIQFNDSAGTSQGYVGYGSSGYNDFYFVQFKAAPFNFYLNGAVRGAISTAGTLTMQGDVIAYGSPSDKRLKENIKPIESALDKVSKLQGVTFDWKEKEKEYDQFGKPKKLQEWKNDIGFIAQDVQKVIPELVRENEDGMLSMRHQGIAPILLEAIKELKAEIEELKLNKCNCNCNK